jgi:RNA recognition motif-containing protein
MARAYRHRNTTKLVLRNLAPNMTAETLNSMLEGHGDVRSVKVMTDVMTGRCSGVAYIAVDELVAGSARAALDGSSYGGRIIQVSIEHKPGRSIWNAESKPIE